MQPVPTAICNLLDAETNPLVKVRVRNSALETARVRIRAYIEGVSAEHVRTVEVTRDGDITVALLPTLLPERIKEMTEVQRATLHIICENLDGKIETHETRHLTCLARTSGFNVVRDPNTGELVDLTDYYGAWVTPYAELVQRRIRDAADLRATHKQMWGYQGKPEDGVADQVEALYNALKAAEIAYVNSVVDYGGGDRYITQRARLPRQSLDSRSANCLDGSVLFASMLEGASLNAALVFVPGHAFVAWEAWEDNADWQFLETTMIGTGDFTAANRSGNEQYAQYQQHAPETVRRCPIGVLRNRGIWPME